MTSQRLVCSQGHLCAFGQGSCKHWSLEPKLLRLTTDTVLLSVLARPHPAFLTISHLSKAINMGCVWQATESEENRRVCSNMEESHICHICRESSPLPWHQLEKRGLQLKQEESQTFSLHSLPKTSEHLPMLFHGTGECDSIRYFRAITPQWLSPLCTGSFSTPGYDVQDEHTPALVVKMVSKSPTCKGHLDCVGHNQLATRVVREGGHASIQYCGVRLQLWASDVMHRHLPAVITSKTFLWSKKPFLF